jgi:2-phosphosulfolactate phosphatase
MNLDVAFLPQDLDPATLPRRAVVVFDVLRATTTMTAALAAGVAQIRVFPETASARQAAAAHQSPKPLLCGEQSCLPPEGFNLGNSPGAFGAAHAGQTLFMSTTNGTRAILAARTAKLLLTGALVNAAAVARVLAGTRLDVTLLCAGTNGQVAMEDVLGAGAVIDALGTVQMSDAATISLRLFQSCRGELRRALAGTAGGRNVIAAGLEPDIDFAAGLDRFPDVVGRVEGAVVSRI